MNSKPTRIQRKRVKGWRMPENTVSVTRPGRWGNPYTIGEYGEGAIDMFEHEVLGYIEDNPDYLLPLRGKNLACFCPLDKPCHGDVLLRLANQEPTP